MLTELIIILFGLVLIAVTLLFFAIANGAFRAPQEVDPESVAVALQPGGTLMVPGAAFVDAMAAHVEGRARALDARRRSPEALPLVVGVLGAALIPARISARIWGRISGRTSGRISGSAASAS